MNNIIDIPTPTIETPTHDDLDEISRLVNTCWHHQYDQHLPPVITAQRTPEFFREQLAKNLHRGTMARINRRLAGFSDQISNCIDNLWVHPDFRRRRIGTRLLTAQLELMQSRGYSSAQVGVESFNTAAIAFYEKLGWNLLEKIPHTEKNLKVTILIYGYRIK